MRARPITKENHAIPRTIEHVVERGAAASPVCRPCQPAATWFVRPDGFDVISGTAPGAGYFQLSAESAFTNAGGVIDLALYPRSFETTMPFASATFDYVVAGSVAAVPEPSTAAMLALSLASMGAWYQLRSARSRV